jgi:hypothetical protein
VSERSSDKREKSRLNKLLESVERQFWKPRPGRASYRMSVNTLRWAAALRRADHSGDCTGLIELLRSRRPMPRGFETTRLARDLLAELFIERWSGHPLVRHRSMKRLFEPKAEDDFRAAAAMVHELQYGGLDGAFEFDTPQMSEEDAIAQAVKRYRKTKKTTSKVPKRRGGKLWRPGITTETLTEYLGNRMRFGKRKQRRKKHI